MKQLKTFINEGEHQIINEILTSGKVYDWKENTDTIPAKRVDFSGSFELDDDIYNVAFFNSTPFFGKYGRYMTITRETDGRLSKTLNFSNKDLMTVMRTVMSITEYYLTNNRRITGLAFLFPMKYVGRAKAVNKLIKYAFRSKPLLKLTLRGAVNEDKKINGRNFILFYTRQDAEFEGKHFGNTNADKNEFFDSLTDEAILSPEDEAEAAAEIPSKDADEKEPKQVEQPEKTIEQPKKAAVSKEVGQPTPEEKKDIEQATKQAKAPVPEPELYPVPQEVLQLEGKVLKLKRSRPDRKWKDGAPEGHYEILSNIEPYTDDPYYFYTDVAEIDTSMSGDEGKLKYAIRKRISIKFILDDFKDVSDFYPERKLNPKAIDKKRKEALTYYENRVELSDHPAGANAVRISNEEIDFARDELPPLEGELLKLYLAYTLNTQFGVPNIENDMHYGFEQTLKEEYDTNIHEVILRASITPNMPKFNTEQIEFVLAHDFGYFESYSGLLSIYKGDLKFRDRQIKQFELYADLTFDSPEEAHEYLKQKIDKPKSVKSIKDPMFIYNVAMNLEIRNGVSTISKPRKLKPKFDFSHKFETEIEDIPKDKVKAYVFGIANEIRENNSQHTLQDLLGYGNDNLRAGTSLYYFKAAKQNNVDEIGMNIKDMLKTEFTTEEKVELAKKIGPDATILFGLEKYSPDEEVFKIDFINSWTMSGGSDSQAAAFSWMSGFGPYNRNNLYNFSDNVYESQEVPDVTLDHFDKIYKHTQDFLQKQLGKKYKDGKGLVKLYRGIGIPYDEAENYVPGSIESWSKTKSTANLFAQMMSTSRKGGAVLEAQVPYDAVFMTYETAIGYFPPEENLKGKKEFIIFGGCLSEYGAKLADTDRTLNFTEWMQQFNEENEMGIKLRIVTKDDEDFDELLGDESLIKGVESKPDETKAEYDEYGNLKEYEDDEDLDVQD